MSNGLSLGLEGLAADWVLVRMAISITANVCRSTVENAIYSFYLLFERMQLCKAVHARPYRQLRVSFRDSLSRITFPFSALTSQLKTLCVGSTKSDLF